MSMLAFFPWLELDANIDLDAFSLLQFRRGSTPGGSPQPAIESVLDLFVVGNDEPVRTATLMRLGQRALTEDFAERERDELFICAELVAFAGLAAREYFAPFHYANRDDFTFIVQAFSSADGGVVTHSRRRDGATRAFSTRGAARVRQPAHIAGSGGVRVDVRLLQALLTLRGMPEWADFEEAIFFFNQANTDSPNVFEQAEVIATTSAFERVLGCRGGRENELAERFCEEWPASRHMLPMLCGRIPRATSGAPGMSIAEVWIRDFFRHRGNLSHGRRTTMHPALWTAREHLLLGAYAFPLLVKCLLARQGLYELSVEERCDVDVFEELACASLFEQEADEDQEHGGLGLLSWPWHRIRTDSKWKCLSDQLWSNLLLTEAGPDQNEAAGD